MVDKEPESSTSNSQAPISHFEDALSQIQEFLKEARVEELSQLIEQFKASEIASAISAMTVVDRHRFWELVPERRQAKVLTKLGEQVRTELLDSLNLEDAVAATIGMDTPDLADVIDEVSDELHDAILNSLAAGDRVLVENRLSYPEECAGRLMERELLAIRADKRLDVIKRYLRQRGSLPRRSTALMVVDRKGVFLGKLPLELLLTKDPDAKVSELMDVSAVSVNILTPLSEVANLFQRLDLVALPVVDDDQRLVGRIVLDDAIELIRAETEKPMLQMAGLEEDEDLLAPIADSAKRRLFWLGINLITAFLAAAVIGLFEATLEKIVALAVLMPIVASMGGIAGSQTLTLAIRGLALDHITDSNRRWLLLKEVAIAVINGLVWAVVVGVIAWLWFGQIGISLILGVAMVINLLAAAVCGLAIPLILDRLGQDPALSGSVVLTTVTDVVGFMSFLGMATLFLL
ncbi:MAG: magnesium transporter [Chromatiaceae bacterium]|nr:magnesium transporter [Chromatiaceae bacterium]MCP5444481.1 magnesium transporter [Chromatiaceae bacterium]